VTSVTVRLIEAQAELLAQDARKLGLTAEDLLRAAVLDLIEGRDEAFLAAARRVIEKNTELYHRLS
jgi:hypothetical protein